VDLLLDAAHHDRVGRAEGALDPDEVHEPCEYRWKQADSDSLSQP
jgi:hypothetical protein